LKVDQNIEFSLRLATSPEDFLKEDAEPFINLLLKGISLGVRLNVWKKISDVLLHIVEAGEVDSSMLPFFGGIAPAFLLRISGHLDLNIDEHMMSKLQEHPLLQPLLMSALSLIDATSNCSSDEDLNEHLNNLDAPPALGKLLKILIEHMADEVEGTITHPQMGVHLRVCGKGLRLVVRNIVKYMDAKEGG
jgi:hypothetical protein